MFHELDATLAEILQQEMSVNDLTITFVTPVDEMFMGLNAPTLNLFLYDIRENWELRSNEWRDERVNGRIRRTPPPIRVDCSYLITVWTAESGEKGAATEHELLGDVMGVLLRHRRIPSEYLPEAWRQEPPLRAKVLQQGNLQSLGEFWQAMGGKPKAALHYTVTISVPTSDTAQDLGLPVAEHTINMRQLPLKE